MNIREKEVREKREKEVSEKDSKKDKRGRGEWDVKRRKKEGEKDG